MHDVWKNLVFVRLLIPFCLGILVTNSFSLPVIDVVPFLLVSTIFVLVLIINYRLRFSYRNSWLSGVVINMLLFAFGALLTASQTPRELELTDINHKQRFTFQLQEKPIEKPNSLKALATIVHHKQEALNGRLLLVYFAKDSLAKQYKKQDTVACIGFLNAVNSPKNPDEFNYKAFLARRNIFYQVFLPAGNHKKINQPFIYTASFLEKMRNYCEAYINTHLQHTTADIAKALLLGQKENLDKETKTLFSRSGTMHILAVSGLHVGIIYLMFSFILSYLAKMWKKIKRLTPFFLIGIIWLFTLLTGGSASTLRAAIMFTLFTLGFHYFPYTHSFNILAATAFLLLVVKPSFIYEVGFQLSFSAVAGILLIFPLMKRQWPGGNRVWQYFKDIIFLTISAQIATLPISIFYFHQMPLLGVLSNLLAVPLAFLIVITGFSGFLLAKVPFIGIGLGYALKYLVFALQWLNQFIASQEFAVLPNLSWSGLQVLAIYLFIGFSLLWIYQKHNRYVLAALGSLFFFIGIDTYRKIQVIHKKELIVYSLSNYQAVECINGNKSVLFSDKPIDESTYLYSIKPNQLKNRIKQTQTVLLDDAHLFFNDFVTYQYPFLQFDNQLIVFEEEDVLADIAIFKKRFPWEVKNDSLRQTFVITNQFPSEKTRLQNAIYTRKNGAFIKQFR